MTYKSVLVLVHLTKCSQRLFHWNNCRRSVYPSAVHTDDQNKKATCVRIYLIQQITSPSHVYS